ncbi:MAG: isocitrate lyase/phosphoenolpyruvate mutase family protein [Chloroflexota bacterium]|jgi:carboxyvinyl-carboxyphosphonate phosphorylmutase|nr:isocitrate lyase/phosphoenolpyruvate mutase family protein [Chloroflexota bacterium]MEC9439075.1 isocitrate lyase/phosphoenolpyruvate mutase family protein [Chloroflexota bacterium]MQF65512.1 oxaloacetate decarboxylase [SAR202 cluster bacterium AC-647-P02_OGT_505m]|tara:strand:+ start:13563 stop:14420 length:858 start_codon:yes stop_codon:yes gene_type:complete
MLDSEKREIFRKVLQGEECLFPGSVYDAVSARLATEVGFEIGMFAGSIGSSVVLGAPDYIVLTLTEFADQARRICRNTDLPLLVDADHGYGNALNVKRTVEELENAGVAALTIEDTDLPRPYGTQKPTLISIDEGIGKMKAALEGRSDSSLIIAGRSSAFSVTSIEDAVERAKQYESAGVDAMFFAGISTREELSAARDAISIPIMLGSVSKELEDKDFLSSMGVKVALQGHLPYMAGVKAVYEVMKALRSGTKPSELGGASQYSDLISRVTRENEHDGWIDKYL